MKGGVLFFFLQHFIRSIDNLSSTFQIWQCLPRYLPRYPVTMLGCIELLLFRPNLTASQVAMTLSPF